MAASSASREYLASLTDPRIHLIHNDSDKGLTHALTQGLALARGMYIARMDDDDISLSERFAMQKTFLDAHVDITAVGTGLSLINSTGATIGTKVGPQDSELIRFYLLTLNQLAHPSVMFRTAAIRGAGGYNEHFIFTQDYELWSCLSAQGARFSTLPATLLHYRVHANSSTQGSTTKETGYGLALQTTRKNLERYLPISDHGFAVFCAAFYRDKIVSLSDLFVVRRIWSRLLASYSAKERPSAAIRAEISRYTRAQQSRALKWYLRRRFGILVAIASRIKKTIRKTA